MLEYKVILGYVAIAIGLISYIPYFRNIFSGATKPHAFSWFVWSLLTGIAFAAQLVKEGGAGAWVTGVTAVACFTIACLALVKGKRDFTLFDWIAFVGALLALVLWQLTHNPTLAVMMVCITDILSFMPTIRKGYYKPFEEGALTFSLSSLKFLIAIFALQSYSLATWFYPAWLVATNGLFVLMLLVRRKQLGPKVLV